MCLKSTQWTLAVCKGDYRRMHQALWDIWRMRRHGHLIVSLGDA